MPPKSVKLPGTRHSVAETWRAGQELGFSVEIKGVPLVEQFLRYQGVDRDVHVFRLFWRFKRKDGGTAAERGAELKTDDFGKPVSYELFSDRDAVQKLTFDERVVIVRRRDGSQLELRIRKPIELVLQANDVLQFALLLPSLRGSAVYRGMNLSPATLAQSEFVMRRRGGRWTASQGFTLECDASGQLQSFHDKDGVAQGHRLKRRFPDVDWQGLLLSKIAPYRAPRNIALREITVSGELPLGAALSLPRRGRPPYPALLFLQGSGRHDRHGISPVLDTGIHEIVDGLAARGIAGLRFDSRGAGLSRFGDAFESGVDARVADARAALRTLASRPEVDADNLFVMGHSLGSLIGIRLAGSARLKGAMLLAPPGRRIDRIVAEQVGRALARQGLAPAEVKLRTRRLARSLVKLRGDSAAERSRWGLTKLAMRDLMQLEPLDLIANLHLPLLICQGAADFQVSVERDAVPLFLRAAEGNRAAELVVLADADHLFRHEIGTSTPERYLIQRPLANGLLDTLEGWIMHHARGR